MIMMVVNSIHKRFGCTNVWWPYDCKCLPLHYIVAVAFVVSKCRRQCWTKGNRCLGEDIILPVPKHAFEATVFYTSSIMPALVCARFSRLVFFLFYSSFCSSSLFPCLSLSSPRWRRRWRRWMVNCVLSVCVCVFAGFGICCSLAMHESASGARPRLWA